LEWKAAKQDDKLASKTIMENSSPEQTEAQSKSGSAELIVKQNDTKTASAEGILPDLVHGRNSH
jgi:hypothetical protein